MITTVKQNVDKELKNRQDTYTYISILSGFPESTIPLPDLTTVKPNELIIPVDAEWDEDPREYYRINRDKIPNPNDRGVVISLQLIIKDVPIFILNTDAIKAISLKYPDEDVKSIVSKVYGQCEDAGYHFLMMEFNDDTDIIHTLLKRCKLRQCNKREAIQLVGFSSPRDYIIAHGWNNISQFFNQKPTVTNGFTGIAKKRCLIGNYYFGEYTGRVRDRAGWVNGGFKKLLESCGLDSSDKRKMDKYKSCMLLGLIRKPEDFVMYSMGDVVQLLEVNSAFPNLVSKVAREYLNVPFSPSEVKDTVGSTIAKVYEKYLHGLHPDNPRALELAFKKLGIISQAHSAKKNKYLRDVLNKVINSVNTVSDMQRLSSQKWLQDFMGFKYGTDDSEIKFVAYSLGSLDYLASYPDKGKFNAIVQGGRCNNEQPWNYLIEYGADIDLNSCYGSALRTLIYPIGLPTVWGYTESEDLPTLEKWLSENKNDLVDDLYQIVVEGTLSFNQDLIYSKLTTEKDIDKARSKGWEKEYQDDDSGHEADVQHIGGDFVLIRNEIENGVITGTVLKTLINVCSEKEWSQIKNLRVKAASAYLASNRIDTLEEWIDIVIADKGTRKNEGGKAGSLKDTRTRCWYGVPLENFIGKLIDARNGIKKQKKTAIDAVEKANLDALQEAMKLFVNTLYGVFASPYFTIGNVILANNITARARVGAWMMNKALNTIQSITDGGAYSLLNINDLDPSRKEGKKPGLETLSDLRQLWNHRNVKTVSMLDVDWKYVFESENPAETLALVCSEYSDYLDAIYADKPDERKANNVNMAKFIDKVGLSHINEFWSHYGLQLPFDIEHKETNFFKKCAYWNKGHYSFDLAFPIKQKDGSKTTRIYKVRGARYYQDRDLDISPVYKLLDDILEGKPIEDIPMGYDHWTLYSVNAYREMKNSKNADSSPYAHLRPGDAFVQRRRYRQNNAHIMIKTQDDYRRILNRGLGKGMKRGIDPVEKIECNPPLFDRHFTKGVKFTVDRMNTNNL